MADWEITSSWRTPNRSGFRIRSGKYGKKTSNTGQINRGSILLGFVAPAMN